MCIVFVEQQGGARNRIGEVRIKTGFIGRVEEGEHPVVILLRDGIVAVIVAPGAFHRQPKKGPRRGVDAVGVVLHAKFLIDAAAFIGLAMIAIESRGQPLLARGVGEKIARKLPDDEVIERQISIEGADDPVAPGPEMIEPVRLIPVGVGIARHVHPFHRHPFAVGRRCEESINEFFVRIGRFVLNEGVDLAGRGREAGEIERCAADQSFAIRLPGWSQSFAFQSRKNKAVQIVPGPLFVAHRWNAGFFRWDERPMTFPLRALFDPSPDQGDVVGRERQIGLGRGHLLVRIGGRNAADDFALGGATGFDDE